MIVHVTIESDIISDELMLVYDKTGGESGFEIWSDFVGQIHKTIDALYEINRCREDINSYTERVKRYTAHGD